MTTPRHLRPPHLRLWGRLLASHIVVVLIGGATVLILVDHVAPGAFDSAMGSSMGDGTAGMGQMMSDIVRVAFRDAIDTALMIAVLAAGIVSVIASVALSSRITRPISRLVVASRRIADGHYAERVNASAADEIGELAASFNHMADSLEATERRRLQLVGDVAHELRTPLTILEGFLEGLEDGILEPDERTWDQLRAETSRLSRLVNDLQELWRAEARQVPMRVQAVDVAASLRSVVDRFAGRAAERKIELLLDVPRRSPAVAADPERLAEILDNLVSNAIRYSPAGGHVTLGGRVDGSEIVLSVADEGPGLTEEQRELVFERFYRVDPSRSRALGGSGIGLAISRALTQAMGGRLWAESPGQGAGSTFRIALPTA